MSEMPVFFYHKSSPLMAIILTDPTFRQLWAMFSRNEKETLSLCLLICPSSTKLASTLKLVGRYASLNKNIYVTAGPTPVDVNHAAHACRFIGRPKYLLSES